MLIDARLERLKESLKVERDKFIGHHVVSRPSPVTNLINELNKNFTFEELYHQLVVFLKKWFFVQNNLSLSEPELRQIKILAQEKFSSWSWNYAYSPSFVYSETIDKIKTTIHCTVKNGIVEQCEPSSLTQNIIGKPFQVPLIEMLK